MGYTMYIHMQCQEIIYGIGSIGTTSLNYERARGDGLSIFTAKYGIVSLKMHGGHLRREI